jgi:hypothetical protein
MNNLRTFQISSELFWGYRMVLDITHFDNIKSIIEYVKSDIRTFLLSRNLQLLVEKLDECKFHIHEPCETFEKVINNSTSYDVIYICDHC